ncbi:MAG TPA: hypothetical protein VJS64_17650 [Pyrinomonadaceae bacterium]|nr:hypothetical protein [Pyrinomonadaceae bacterium]
MVANKKQNTSKLERAEQRGAALLTCLMISMMLLGIAGMVILTTSMSATTSVESTAEMQAYYGAESGLEATMNVLRGNVAPRTGMPTGIRIGFRNAVQLNRSNLPSDTSTVARLSGWLPYDNATGRVAPAGTNYAYNVTLRDPDDWNGVRLAAEPAYSPSRLLVQANGFGPRGSTKRMEMVVQRVLFDFKVVAALAMRSADDNVSTMTFSIGNSAAKKYSGHDFTGTQPALPSIVVTGAQDLPIAADAITKGSTVEPEQVKLLPVADLPDFLKTADNARTFLNYMQAVSRSMGRYYTSYSGYAGTTASPQFTFVNGNCSLDGGAGLLLVTGKLTMAGTPNFDGIILVLGGGDVERDGAGNGNVLGTMYVARFARNWPANENGQPHPFLAPTFITNGSGTADLRYDSPRVTTAQNVLGTIVRDIREY